MIEWSCLKGARCSGGGTGSQPLEPAVPVHYYRARNWKVVLRPRFELGTPAFSVQCSTD